MRQAHIASTLAGVALSCEKAYRAIPTGVVVMHIREVLAQRRDELIAGQAEVEAELHDIDLALKAMSGAPAKAVEKTSMASRFQIRHSMPVNDAIVKAVEAGRKTPVDILNYLQNELGVQTTLNSVRSRVSPLKQEGKIGHDGTGWVPSQQVLAV